MSGFLNSVVRGAGMSIGRNLVGDFGRSKQTKTSHRYYDRAENEIEKALNFPIQGRSDTLLGKCFNLYQAFDDESKSTYLDACFTLMFFKNKVRYYNQVFEKTSDVIEYLKLKNENDENIEKIDEIEERVNTSFKKCIIRISDNILTIQKSKDKKIAKGYWDGDSSGMSKTMKQLYIEMDGTNVTQIDEYLKPTSIFNRFVPKSILSKSIVFGIFAWLLYIWVIR